MPNKTQQHSLYLYPIDTQFQIETKKLIENLSSIDFIGSNIQETKADYLVGNRFFDYITFLGCAPSLQFTATDNSDKFCFIRIIDYDNKKLIRTKLQARDPACPNCKKTITKWNGIDISSLLKCPHCHETSYPEEFNWKKTAGIARFFIEITDIFPKEAIPQPSFLEKLSNITNSKWQYFYYST